MVAKLSEYPWVIVRLGCRYCNRRGQYRLARLAAKFGPEITMDDLLDKLAFDCPCETLPNAIQESMTRSAERCSSTSSARHHRVTFRLERYACASLRVRKH